MSNDSWSKIKDIVDAAIRREPDQRPVFLDEACGDDADVRREVESLLSSFGKAEDFLEKPAVILNDEAETAEFQILPAGRMIGRYEIVRKLGEGGMGTVFLAKDEKLDRQVAIKILARKYQRSDENIRRFVREAKAASALNHPNILTIHEIDEYEGSQYIVSEFIDGETLRDVIRKKFLELNKIIDIAKQIAGALAAAHKARIIHRDIKPENVIVRSDGYVKVLDFGLAKLLPKDVSTPSLADSAVKPNETAKGIILGTVCYMSPEQAHGKTVDERTDIFSLGVVLYEMIAGRTPFAGDSMAETFANLINKEPSPLSRSASGIPEEMERIVAKMLRKDPELRYQTMGDCIADLKNVSISLGHSVPITRASDGEDQRTAVIPRSTGDHKNSTTEASGNYAPWYRRRPVIAAIAMLFMGAIGIGYWYLARPSTRVINSVAVLPFVNESGDSQVEYLSDGMTDTLISSLSELPNIKVKARTSVFRYKGKEIDPKTIGKELGVQAIVNGRVAQRGGRTNVTLEVVDTETEDVIFSTKYDKPQSALVTLQSDIARDVSRKLKSKLSGAEEAKVTKTHTADSEALQLYLQGQFYSHKGGRSNVLRATDYFNKAIEKDPNYALAYAGLASSYSSYGFYNIARPADYTPKAKAAAKRALELDDSLAEAHVALGASGAANAEQEFRRAIELNPNYAEAHGALCVSLRYQKRFDDAIAECKKAQELDPSSSIATTALGATYAFARRPDEAIEMFRRAHEMDPTLFVPLGYLGFAQTLKGQYTEAIATFRKAIEVSDGSPNAKSHLAYALAKAGQRDEALKLVDELKRQAAHEHIASFHFAVPYIGLGDKDEAFFRLGKGIDEQTIDFTELDLHPWYDDLRSDPRFSALLKRVKPPES